MKLTAGELAQLRCTAEEGLDLLIRRGRRQRAAMLADLAADLPGMREEDLNRSLRARRDDVQLATSEPEADDDVAFVWASGRGLAVGGVTLPARGGLHYVPRAVFDAEVAPALEGWHRGVLEQYLQTNKLLVLRDGVRNDLVGAIRIALADPVHRGEHGVSLEADVEVLVRERLVEVLETIGDPSPNWARSPGGQAMLDRLQRWHGNAEGRTKDGTSHASLIADRLLRLGQRVA